MNTRPNRKPPSVPLAPTALLSMALALSACSDKQEKAPSTPAAATPAPASDAARTPEQLFSSLGCPACHGPGRAYASALANARGKPPEVVAMWILDPQKVKPGTMMPSFVGRLSTSEALALAQWIKAGNPAPSPTP